MSSIKVLLLSPFFYPETISTGKYNTVLAEALVAAGASVEVITSHPFYPGWKPVPSTAELGRVSIIRGGQRVRYPSVMIWRRLVLEIWYTMHACWTIVRRRPSTDIVIGVFPPNLFFCFVPAILHSRVKKIGIVHDFQATLGVEGSGVFKRYLRWLVKTIERKSFRRCDTLITLSRAMERRASCEYGIDPVRLLVAYPFVSIESTPGRKTNLEAILPEDCLHIVYSGALGKKQNPMGLLGFFRAAAWRLPNVRLHIFSEGPIFNEMKKMNAENPAMGVHFHGLVAPEDLEELYARSTIQVIPQAEGSEDACLPSKLPNILATGCAVFGICASGSELAEVIHRCSGLSVSSWEPDVLVDELGHFLKQVTRQSREERRELAAPILSSQFSLGCLVRTLLSSDDRDLTEPK